MTRRGIRESVASYSGERFGPRGLKVYREVRVGKSIIGKNRCIDVFCVREADSTAFAIECKFQDSAGTVDEKIPYALDDLDALPMAGCIAYAGKGFSDGVLHMLNAVAARGVLPAPSTGRRHRPSTRASSTTAWRRTSAGGTCIIGPQETGHLTTRRQGFSRAP